MTCPYNRDMGKEDIVIRLTRWVHAVDAEPASDLMDEAAEEIRRLRREVVSLLEKLRGVEPWADGCGMRAK